MQLLTTVKGVHLNACSSMLQTMLFIFEMLLVVKQSLDLTITVDAFNIRVLCRRHLYLDIKKNFHKALLVVVVWLRDKQQHELSRLSLRYALCKLSNAIEIPILFPILYSSHSFVRQRHLNLISILKLCFDFLFYFHSDILPVRIRRITLGHRT